MRSPVELSAVFRQRGLKVTPQRELIFRLLHENRTHPTAEAVYSAAVEAMPMISLKTVYQVLNDLKSLGEIRSIEVGTGAIRFDPNLADHHHLVCDQCGVVHDVDVNVSDLALRHDQQHGFAVADLQVTFRGICAACQTPASP